MSTSRSGQEKAYQAPPNEGKTTHPIRGQAPSPLQSDEQSKIRKPTSTIGSRGMWPKKGSHGHKEDAQAR